MTKTCEKFDEQYREKKEYYGSKWKKADKESEQFIVPHYFLKLFKFQATFEIHNFFSTFKYSKKQNVECITRRKKLTIGAKSGSAIQKFHQIFNFNWKFLHFSFSGTKWTDGTKREHKISCVIWKQWENDWFHRILN